MPVPTPQNRNARYTPHPGQGIRPAPPSPRAPLAPPTTGRPAPLGGGADPSRPGGVRAWGGLGGRLVRGLALGAARSRPTLAGRGCPGGGGLRATGRPVARLDLGGGRSPAGPGGGVASPRGWWCGRQEGGPGRGPGGARAGTAGVAAGAGPGRAGGGGGSRQVGRGGGGERAGGRVHRRPGSWVSRPARGVVLVLGERAPPPGRTAHPGRGCLSRRRPARGGPGRRGSALLRPLGLAVLRGVGSAPRPRPARFGVAARRLWGAAGCGSGVPLSAVRPGGGDRPGLRGATAPRPGGRQPTPGGGATGGSEERGNPRRRGGSRPGGWVGRSWGAVGGVGTGARRTGPTFSPRGAVARPARGRAARGRGHSCGGGGGGAPGTATTRGRDGGGGAGGVRGARGTPPRRLVRARPTLGARRGRSGGEAGGPTGPGRARPRAVGPTGRPAAAPLGGGSGGRRPRGGGRHGRARAARPRPGRRPGGRGRPGPGVRPARGVVLVAGGRARRRIGTLLRAAPPGPPRSGGPAAGASAPPGGGARLVLRGRPACLGSTSRLGRDPRPPGWRPLGSSAAVPPCPPPLPLGPPVPRGVVDVPARPRRPSAWPTCSARLWYVAATYRPPGGPTGWGGPGLGRPASPTPAADRLGSTSTRPPPRAPRGRARPRGCRRAGVVGVRARPGSARPAPPGCRLTPGPGHAPRGGWRLVRVGCRTARGWPPDP